MDIRVYLKEETFSDAIEEVWNLLSDDIKKQFTIIWRNGIDNNVPLNPRLLKEFYRNLNHQIKAFDYLSGILDNNKNLKEAFFKGLEKRKMYQDAINLIKEFEGLSLEAYPDPLTKGEPWTIGYGSTRYLDGSPVRRGDKITKKTAELLLEGEVESVAKRLSMTIPFWDVMDEKMQSALISFAFNLGKNFYNSYGFNTISKVLREKRWEEVPRVLELYRNPNTNVEAGLLRRRRAEGNLWRQGLKNVTSSSR